MDIAERGLAGQIAWFGVLADRGVGRSSVEGSGTAVVTGLWSNSDNGIVLNRAALNDERAVRSLVGTVLEQGLPASLVLSEPAPDTETALLLELGLTPETSASFMGGLIDSRPAPGAPLDVELGEVVDGAGLRRGLLAIGDGWLDERQRRKYTRLYEQLGFGPGRQTRHWIAERRGRTIAMATSFLFGETVVLLHCGVVESERRRGVATALTASRLQAAVADGATGAVLSPSPDGYELHRRLGFELVAFPPNRWFYLPQNSKLSLAKPQATCQRK